LVAGGVECRQPGRGVRGWPTGGEQFAVGQVGNGQENAHVPREPRDSCGVGVVWERSELGEFVEDVAAFERVEPGGAQEPAQQQDGQFAPAESGSMVAEVVENAVGVGAEQLVGGVYAGWAAEGCGLRLVHRGPPPRDDPGRGQRVAGVS
jgi:hypothetical protein